MVGNQRYSVLVVTTPVLIAALWLLSTQVGSQPQSPPSAPVTVVNGSTNAIPVRASTPVPVTGTVSVAGTSTVNAEQRGPWTVGITGTPQVSLAGPVAFTKTIVPVRVSDQQSVEPGNVVARFSAFYTVPAGKRLIVEHISCAFFLHPPDSLTCGIEEFNFARHSTSPASTPAGSTEPVVIVTGQAVKVIFGPGESFAAVVDWGRASVGRPGAFFTLSGYLEDAQ